MKQVARPIGAKRYRADAATAMKPTCDDAARILAGVASPAMSRGIGLEVRYRNRKPDSVSGVGPQNYFYFYGAGPCAAAAGCAAAGAAPGPSRSAGCHRCAPLGGLRHLTRGTLDGLDVCCGDGGLTQT